MDIKTDLLSHSLNAFSFYVQYSAVLFIRHQGQYNNFRYIKTDLLLLFSLQATFHSQPYPTWVMAVIFLLILASALCLPMVAILRKLGIMKYDSAKSAVILTGGTTQSTAAMLADYPEADSGRSESDSYSLESNTQVDSKIDITNVDSCVGESIEVSELNKGYLVLKMSESNI